MTNADIWREGIALSLQFFAAVIISVGLILLLRPVLARYALARPNSRTSHAEPTPQGAGIAVIGSIIATVIGAAIFTSGLLNDPISLVVVLTSASGLAAVGATDDIRPLEALPRLFLQATAVGVIVAALPADLRIISALPWWIERLGILLCGVWFVNLVNFMDGIDWMTVAEILPLTAGLTIFGLMGEFPKDGMVVALALCGAIVGFAPFNRPVARLFLGDVGSLPIGLLVGWLLVLLAGQGHFAAALILPLYYLLDTTITLLRRLFSGEQVMQAHRSHFYQRAMDNGFSVYEIVGRVFTLNIALVALAAATIVSGSLLSQFIMLGAGGILVVALLWDFSRVRR
jgi:UDP-N-acetylmuramyl pentapeptide phosphotransferase/UDP-N-acetylglucosamine-1-phosphate transferase